MEAIHDPKERILKLVDMLTDGVLLGGSNPRSERADIETPDDTDYVNDWTRSNPRSERADIETLLLPLGWRQ